MRWLADNAEGAEFYSPAERKEIKEMGTQMAQMTQMVLLTSRSLGRMVN